MMEAVSTSGNFVCTPSGYMLERFRIGSIVDLNLVVTTGNYKAARINIASATN
jgi:hypothetical protein